MKVEEIKIIGVLGAGTMGNGIAHVFAKYGYTVILRDIEQRFLDRALDTISKNLDREIKKGKVVEADKPAILARIQTTTDMAAIARADFVVEAVPENAELKKKVLQEVDALLRPDVMPKGDLALHAAYKKLKNLDRAPRSYEFQTIAEQWKPHRASAARLLWHFYLSERKG